MEEDNIEQLFAALEGSLDIKEPASGHQERFLEKLQLGNNIDAAPVKKSFWSKPLSIAAAIVVLIAVGIGLLNQTNDTQEQMAKISPEVSNTQFYFASLIQEQVKELQSESTPETQRIITDTMTQLASLERDYGQLEQEMLSGGNKKILLKAMITNFQTRIDLLQDVLEQIETIKNLKNYNDANYTL
ncbi:hypothetical protein ACFQZJ_06445 [Maribacter chungangensis]|uniref:DUF4179 domain-containing protein n=1 Tax=Maribacter chungangensis TaxID=1069117 RepID=A0ABW3B1B4_9FLAO